ncbi:MAG: cation transporter [Flavobacteriaceae bacterium]|nr:cation transporter [Flavobacteriaceae bacterium]
MKSLLTAVLFASTVLASSVSMAADKTIKLSLPSMSCASCPYIVKGSINMLDGIKSVEATMKDLSATVTYDDTLTNVEEIREATADVGFPSTVIQ